MTVSATEKPYLQEAICAGFFNKPAETAISPNKNFATPEVMTFVKTLSDTKIDEGINNYVQAKIAKLKREKQSYDWQITRAQGMSNDTQTEIEKLETFMATR